ncbi:STT3 domain-containing protein [Methanothermobacter tenebrarum]|uniref:dolichyl-phosphooligosaccharide-protein glycotransferase n=1 Tax=Methanothermobacter tenebrarum TaxID=680118 RepID=A0A328PAD3_9EURY|nr:STT3 domain-containing protein [Methanothermobacter tenebrarum]MBC7118473.1 glycosyltransferase family 39 protein [Methanobacteriaceae archaeon]NPV64027.1 peptide transporter [Methanobacteriaceae archaeon]RAO79199.1 peptide transporter [Methanothermobacter tenebrarum]
MKAEKIKPLIIITVLFLLAFAIRAEAYNIGGVPKDSKQFYKDQNGLPYFSEMDSYYNYRLTMNYLHKGILGDTKVNGQNWDLHSYYPPGRPVDYPPLIVYVTSFVYRLVNMFGDYPLTVVAYWIGAIIGSLCVIPAYLFTRKISNDYGGVVAAIIIGFTPVYVSHTYAGFFDTDMFNVILPLLFIWFFMESISADNLKRRLAFILAAIISILLFSMAWVGYIFYVAVIGVFIIVYFLLKHFMGVERKIYKSRVEWLVNQRELSMFLLLIIIGGLLFGLLKGFPALIGSISQLVSGVQLQATAQTTNYPNVYVSVSELQVPTFTEGNPFLPNQASVLGGVGGLLPFLCGLLGVGVLIWRIRSLEAPRVEMKKAKVKRAGKKSKFIKYQQDIPNVEEKKREYLSYLSLICAWLLLTGYAVTKGFRFVSLFAIPLGISAGIFTGYFVEYLKDNLKSTTSIAIVAFIAGILIIYPFKVSVIAKILAGIIAIALILSIKNEKFRATSMMILVTLAIVSAPISGAHALTSSVVPGTDDGMWNSLTWIKNNTSKDTVVMSWWDFGYLFAVAADRPVTFDGGSQNTPRAFWIGKALLTDNESLSLGILTMLSTSGDMAYNTLDNYTNNTSLSVKILTETLGVPKDEAREIMMKKYKLTAEQADNVLRYSHPDKKKPFVLILSSDMLGKAAWWSYFGSWNFDKKEGEHYAYYTSLAASKPEVADGNVTRIVTVNDPSGLVGVLIEKKANETNATIVVVGANGTSEKIKPHRLMLIEGNQLVKNEIVDKNSPFGLLVVGSEGSYMTVIMDKKLEDSMFTKLFLLGGFNQTSFKLLHQEPGVLVWTRA